VTNNDRLLPTLRADADQLVELAGGDLSAPVPTCPGWNLADLLGHLGRVHRWTAICLQTPPDGDRPRFEPRPPEGAALGPWVREGLDTLITAFDTPDLDRPVWTFVGPGDVGWWLRRQTLETAMHRLDAQLAAGTATDPIDQAVAAIGVDEWCEIETARWFRPSDDVVMSVHLHATDEVVKSDEVDADLPGEWFLEADATALRWSHGHHKGDIAVRASREQLFLLIWRRLPLADVEILGDPDRLADFLLASAVD
jgi:uncharacterized protein (TIGR03083 family)